MPVCPELEVGMGVPREPVRLERRARALRMIAPRSGADWDERMRAFAVADAEEPSCPVDGYVK